MTTAAEKATDTATRLKVAAEFAEAWAAGEFRQVTTKEAWDFGFDADSDTPLIFETDTGGGHAAIWNEQTRQIEFTDAWGADAWTVNPDTGELRRG